MTPFRRQPGIVEVEPAHHRADVKGRSDRIELVGSTGNPCARTGHCRTRDNRSKQLGAGRVVQGEQAATERIHQAKSGRVDRFFTPDPLDGEHIVGNLLQ